MVNKTIIITGANSGIGKQTAKELAAKGAKIYMACRSINSANKVKNEIMEQTNNKNVFVRKIDLSSLDSVRSFVNNFDDDENTLDVLINNAGVMKKNKELNENNVEMTFAINVLGHHLLTKLLIDKLKNSNDARIINVASDYAGGLEIDDINFDRRKYDLTDAYRQSKQANRMLTNEWAKRLKPDGIDVFSLTPGFVPSTNIFREERLFGSMGGRSVEQGADTVIYLATAENVKGNTGDYFRDRKPEKDNFNNETESKRLWDKCEELIS